MLAFLSLVLVLPAGVASALTPDTPQSSTSFNAPVRAVAYDEAGDTVYVGGLFTAATDTSGATHTRNHVAAVDASTGELLPWDPNANGEVWALAVDGGDVYLGGAFRQVDGEAHVRVAKVSAASGAPDAGFAHTVNRLVRAATVHDGSLYIGGSFTEVNGQSRDHLAAFDLADDSLRADWTPTTAGNVLELAGGDDRVYVGGLIPPVIDGLGYLDALNTGNGAADNTFSPSVNYAIHALAVTGTAVYAGGDGEGGHLRAFTLGGANIWDFPTDGGVQAVTVQGGTIYFGGHFDNACRTARPRPGQCSLSNLVRRRKIGALNLQGDLLDWAPQANSNNGVFTLDSATGPERVAAGGAFGHFADGSADEFQQPFYAQFIGTTSEPPPANEAPTATDGTVTTDFETPVDITLQATDPDDDALTYTHDTPAHGTLSGAGESLTYTPDNGFEGADSFTFTAADQQGASDTGTVGITVGPRPVVAPLVDDVRVSLDGRSPVIAWRRPADADYPDVLVRRRNGRVAPATTDQGTRVFRGSARRFTDRVRVGRTYSYSIWTVNRDGTVADRRTSVTMTALPRPRVGAPTHTYRVARGLPFRVRWGSANDPNGTRYLVQARSSGDAWKVWRRSTTARSAVFGRRNRPLHVRQGGEYRFRVVAIDRWGNRTRATHDRSQVARDDRRGRLSRGWREARGGGRWLGTVSTTTRRGAAIRFVGRGREWTVFGDRMPRGSRFAVYSGGRRIGTFSSRAARPRVRAQLWHATFPNARRRVIRVVNLSTPGRRVLRIDGFEAF